VVGDPLPLDADRTLGHRPDQRRQPTCWLGRITGMRLGMKAAAAVVTALAAVAARDVLQRQHALLRNFR